jgi:hypothetical protein
MIHIFKNEIQDFQEGSLNDDAVQDVAETEAPPQSGDPATTERRRSTRKRKSARRYPLTILESQRSG